MRPIEAGAAVLAASAALLDKIGYRVGKVGQEREPRTQVGRRPVGVLPRQCPHLTRAAPPAEDAQQLERLSLECQLQWSLADRPRTSSSGEAHRTGRTPREQIFAQQIGHHRHAGIYGVGSTFADPTQCVTNVVLVRQPVEDELPATRPLDEPFDISREPLVHELLDRAALAICDVTVDPCLAVGAGHTAGAEVDGEAGQMGDGVADSPRGAGGDHDRRGGTGQGRHVVDDATADCSIVGNQIDLCHGG